MYGGKSKGGMKQISDNKGKLHSVVTGNKTSKSTVKLIS